MSGTPSRTLVAWIGHTDLRAAGLLPALRTPAGLPHENVGPIAQAVREGGFDHLCLLDDIGKGAPYKEWLCVTSERLGHPRPSVEIYRASLAHDNPSDFEDVYRAVVGVLEQIRRERGPNGPAFAFLLNPGTPTMQTIWILLSRTGYPAELIDVSEQRGLRVVHLPFELAVEHVTERAADRIELERYYTRLQADIRKPLEKAFEAIRYRSAAMAEAVETARRYALRGRTAVLILGESGTGKEMFARAIHEAARAAAPFIPVNCAAIPGDLMEAELFGYAPHAFSGASPKGKEGYFELAADGTLFLDEIGEAPAALQAKLLRVLQGGEYWRVGGKTPYQARCRVIAATNRNLDRQAANDAFRLDLLHRLAVLVLRLPSLREREGDVGLLLDHFLESLNREYRDQPDFPKQLSPAARNAFLRYHWPGNVRELENTLRRACCMTLISRLEEQDVHRALTVFPIHTDEDVFNCPYGENFRLDELLRKVERHHLLRALESSGGNRTRAAEQLGLSSHQTLTNKLLKHPDLLEKYPVRPSAKRPGSRRRED